MDCDVTLGRAEEQILAVLDGRTRSPVVKAFFDEETFTASYVVYDPISKIGGIIDSVLNFDQAAGRTHTASADLIVAFVERQNLKIEWLLETHAHADHLSAAPYLQKRLGGHLAIGADIVSVQKVFGEIFNEGPRFARDGSQFDRLLRDGDVLAVGELPLIAIHVPGHTPADMAYVVGDVAFTGDTLLMPDYGTARTDFPGGDAHKLYKSIRRLLRLPEQTRVFLCHDYMAPGRNKFMWETTIAAQRRSNIHVHEGIAEEQFVSMRTKRDATLPMPKLILPSIQVNMRAGQLPDPEDNGRRYLKIPLNQL